LYEPITRLFENREDAVKVAQAVIDDVSDQWGELATPEFEEGSISDDANPWQWVVDGVGISIHRQIVE